MRAIRVPLIVAGVLGFLLSQADVAHATVHIAFTPISNNSGSAALLTDQLWLEIADVGGQVEFTFYNLATGSDPQWSDWPGISVTGDLSTIAAVYFADGNVIESGDISEESLGVDFKPSATPGDLPGSGNFDNWTLSFAAGAKPPPADNGIDPGEYLKIRFDYASGKDYGDVVSAINNFSGEGDTLQVGIHVISIGDNEGSDSFVVVPETGTIALWTCLFGVAGAVGWYRRRKAK